MTATRSMGAVSRAVLVALAVVVLAGLVVGVRQWLKPPTKPKTAVGESVADDFLRKVREGKSGEAWDGATAEFKSIEGRESFIRSAAKATVLKARLSFVSMQDVQVKDEPRAEYIFQTPDAKMVRVLVGYEGGAWKVDRLTL